MASIINGVNSALPSSLLTNAAATRKVAVESTATSEKPITARASVVPPLRPEPDFEKVFSAENFLPASTNRALSEYVSIQNNEKREQLSQLLGLDIYA